MVLALWLLRTEGDVFDAYEVYGTNPNVFSLKINHSGVFIHHPTTCYIDGKSNYVDFVNGDEFSMHEINAMIQELGYPENQIMFYHFRIPDQPLKFGLRPLGNDDDIRFMLDYISNFKVLEIYTEHWVSKLNYDKSLCKVVIEELIHGENQENVNGNQEDVNVNQQEDDVIVDKNNIVNVEVVDMRSFKVDFRDHLNEDEEVDVHNNIDLDDFESSSDEDDLDKAVRKFRKKNKSKNMDDVPFYVGQTFPNKEEIAKSIKTYALKTRRQLYVNRNEKLKYSAICIGVNPSYISQQLGGSTSDLESKRKRHPTPTCPWRLYLSKNKVEDSWLVKTFIVDHHCLQTRHVKLYTVSTIAKDVEAMVESNPDIPIKALQDFIQKKYQISVHMQKIFRAKVMAMNKLHGDFTSQYMLLRDYCEELMRSNPNTTVKLEVEREFDPTSQSRKFKRIYICYGALKTGFKLAGRDILGLDGCFMKGPYPGQILTAVSVDGNNGIYPVAFAVVEAETLDSWTWFLNYLGDDLDLYANSNFTFVTDRQKGLVPALNKVFPAAEHRYCLRHLHENMKSNKWRGNLYKDLLWRCASATTVPHFNKIMNEIEKQDQSLHKWLQDIPAKHWSRSHFSGRPKCDVLINNLCEVFNKQLVGGRDKPIITCLEFIREYIMRRIGVVNKLIAKENGFLTPAATNTFKKIKSDAAEYNVTFNGQTKYQVSGPWGEDRVVDIENRSCSCRRWELTGMPCKHVVAVLWNMADNSIDVGEPEAWVDQVYWLDTWRKVYKNSIDPINGRDMWTSSACPTTLLPPKHHTQVGRPKKARRKSAEELSQKMTGVGKMPRTGRTVKCLTCGNFGHNKRSCKGQGTSLGANKGQEAANQGQGSSQPSSHTTR